MMVRAKKKSRLQETPREEEERVLESPLGSLDDDTNMALVVDSSCEDSVSPFELREEWGEDESVFSSLSSDVLYYMFSCFLARERAKTRLNTLLVCRRWGRVGTAALSPFETTKALAHGVFVDMSILPELANNPRLPADVLDPDLMRAVCNKVSDRSTLVRLVSRGVDNDRLWLECCKEAVEHDNQASLECLIEHRRERPSAAFIIALLKRACFKQSEKCLATILRIFSEECQEVLSSQAFVLWCCEKKLSMTLSALLQEPVFCTMINLIHVLEYALHGKIEILVRRIFALGGLDPVIHGPRVLKEACRQGWTSVARDLVGKVSPVFGDQTPLRIATINGYKEIVQIILGHPDTHPGHRFNEPVRRAIESSRWDIVSMLLRDPRVDVNSCDPASPQTSVLCCAMFRNCPYPQVVAAILLQTRDPNQYNHLPLRAAMTKRNIPLLDVLLRDPRVVVSRAEFYSLLSIMSDARRRGNDEARGLVDEMMKSRRFSEHFHKRGADGSRIVIELR